jgi:hypothetical protein
VYQNSTAKSGGFIIVKPVAADKIIRFICFYPTETLQALAYFPGPNTALPPQHERISALRTEAIVDRRTGE